MSVWVCVECGLPDVYRGHGDGIGSCMCLRCPDCGECQPCADQLGSHPRCGEEEDEAEWEPWDDEDFRGQDPVLPRPAAVPCTTPELCQWRPFADREAVIRWDAVGCGIEYGDLDDDGSAEADRWRRVRTIDAGEWL